MKEVSAKNTKTEIMDAYNELLEKLQDQASDKPQELKEREIKKQTVENASKNNTESIVKNISGLKLDISAVLDKVGDNLLAEFKRLTEIQDAISIEKANLEDLYQLSADTDSLAAILLAQKQKRAEFEAEMIRKEEELNQKLKAVQEKHDKEIEEQRSKWEKEKKDTGAALKDEMEKNVRERIRELEEYNYNLLQSRKKEQDVYEQKMTAQENEMKERKAAFEKDIAQREKFIAEQENEFNLLKKQAEQFPKELEKAVKEAEIRITEKLETHYKFEKELLAKDIEGQFKLKDQTIKNLETKLSEQENLIKQLGQKVDGSEKTVKEIVIKAIESSAKIQLVEKQGRKEEKE